MDCVDVFIIVLLPHDAMHTRGLCHVAVSVCPSIRLLTFVYCVKTSNHIFKSFLSSGSHTILVFPHQTLWQYSDGDPLAGTEIVIIDQYLALVSMTGVVLSVLNSADRAVKFIAGHSDDEVTKRHARINESCLWQQIFRISTQRMAAILHKS